MPKKKGAKKAPVVTIAVPLSLYNRASQLIGYVDCSEDPAPHRQSSAASVLRIAAARGLEELEYQVKEAVRKRQHNIG